MDVKKWVTGENGDIELNGDVSSGLYGCFVTEEGCGPCLELFTN